MAEKPDNNLLDIGSTGDAAKDDFFAKARAVGWTETVALDYNALQQSAPYGESYGAAARYEWADTYGDVGPADPELEKILYGSELITREGTHREHIDGLEVKLEGTTKFDPVKSFDDAGIHPVVLENVKHCGYTTPTPIQQYTLPAVKLGYDVVAIAQTGSGKTAAYMIPVLSKLMGKAKKLAAPKPDTLRPGFDPKFHGVRAEPLVVIIVPTRELAIQIFDEARRMCYRSMLRPCVAYGGFPMGECISELRKGCDILIGTPGRLCDLMDKPDILSMSRVKFTIIDEADEMVNEDWQDELGKILGGGDANEDADHIYMMFSATFNKNARELAREYMSQDYTRIRVGRAGQSHKNIRQEIIHVEQDQKREALYDLIFSMEPGRTLIFCNSKPAVDLLDDFLYNRGLPSTSIHADRTQREREDAIRAFRTGRAPILIATGVSARGWDVKDVKHVINYDLPSNMYGGITEYVHRIGRTARIGNQGLATSFYNDRNEDMAQDLVNILVECDCPVPEFLAQYAPEDGAGLQFDDDTDDEAEAAGDGDAWGGAAADGDGGAPIADAWGAATSGGEADSGFQATDEGFKSDGGAGGGW